MQSHGSCGPLPGHIVFNDVDGPSWESQISQSPTMADAVTFTTGSALTNPSSQEQPLSGPPRWLQGCYAHYSLGQCSNASCINAHDLDALELHYFLKWMFDIQHQVFPSKSDETACSTKTDAPGRFRQSITECHPIVTECRPIIEHLPYEEYVRRLRQRFHGMSETAIAATVPSLPSGEASSMGSVLHVSDKCRPCRYLLESKSCRNGQKCMFCHLPHNTVTQQMATTLAGLAEHIDLVDGKQNNDGYHGKFRVCKAKRDRYKKAVKKVEEEILQDPFRFEIESVEPPQHIAKDPDLKKKFLMHVASIVDSARASLKQSRVACSAKSHVANDTADGSNVSRRERVHL